LIIEEGGEIQAEKPLNLLSNSISGVSSLTIDGNAKNTIIDNDFNTLDAGSANIFNVNTGGIHDFTINNQQKFTIDTLATYRLPIKLLNNALQFQTTANIETIGTSNINFDLDGEFLDIKSDPITDNALEFTTSLPNFSFNKNVILPSINSVKYIYQASDLPNPITTGEYVIMGDIALTTSYNINAGVNVSIRGIGRSKTKLRWTAITGLEALTIVDANVDIANLSLESDTGPLISYVNVAKDKVFSMTDCEITNVNGSPLNIEGGDLIDLLQVLCWYNFGNATSNFINVSKLQITSCEFLRYFERGSAPLNWATGNMIALSGSHGATNITSNLMHPQQTQNGIFIQDGATIYSALASAIVANTFIDIGLTTGQVYRYGGTNTIDNYPFLITSNNIGYENETALAEMRLEGNTLNTAVGMANTAYPINGGTAFTFPLTKRVSTANTGTITYTAKNPTYFSIQASFKLTVVAGGNNQDIEVGLLVNGTPVATCKQVIELDQNVFQNTSLNCLGFAEQSSVYQLYVANNTGANNVLVSDVVFTGFQI
jgi:hypothetical protein